MENNDGNLMGKVAFKAGLFKIEIIERRDFNRRKRAHNFLTSSPASCVPAVFDHLV